MMLTHSRSIETDILDEMIGLGIIEYSKGGAFLIYNEKKGLNKSIFFNVFLNCTYIYPIYTRNWKVYGTWYDKILYHWSYKYPQV